MTPRLFTAELWLPRPRDEVFRFFGDATNLEAITPPWVNFHILTPAPIVMRPGTLIDYRLRLHGFPLRWQTEITAWEPSVRFVDEQRRGPYRLWRHTHTFEDKDGGTLCRDRVEYAVWGGALIERLFVRRDVARIFAFRQQALTERFPPLSRAAN
jgi:ligand-binding SRPBCC domain-containing protein